MNRINLFGDDSSFSPVMKYFSPGRWDAEEKGSTLTPLGTAETLPSATQEHQRLTTATPSGTPVRLGRFHSFDVKRSLFSRKRPVEDQDNGEIISPVSKRLREAEMAMKNCSISHSPKTFSDNIIRAVDRLATDKDLVADGSRDCCLPTVAGKHQDLKAISPATMADVLRGNYDNVVDEVTVVDCRYPYEFHGGHIKGALNLYTKENVNKLLDLPVRRDGRHIVIFHCEFSSERGPKMYRFLRSQDRLVNKDNYPKLNFPEIYLLEGGYKAFFQTQQTLCEPVAYTPMLHEDHAADLRHFRVKSKSCPAFGTQHRHSRTRNCLRF